MEDNNTTPLYGDQDNSIPPLTERLIEFVIMGVITLLSFVGNISLWFIVLRNRQLRTVSNWMVLCLSGADLIISAINMPFIMFNLWMGKWVLPEWSCVALGFLCMVSFIASVMSLASISWNRYLFICHMTKSKAIYTKKNAVIIIAGVWLTSVLLALPPVFGWGRYDYIPTQSICFCQWKASISYTFFMVVVCFGGPCSTMAFCYVKILREIRESKRRLETSKQNVDGNSDAWISAAQRLKQRGQSSKQENTTQVEKLPTPTKINLLTSGVGNPSDRFALPSGEADSGGQRSVGGEKSCGGFRKKVMPAISVIGLRMSNVVEKTATTTKPTKAERRRSEEIKLTRTFLVIILTFILFWFPFCVTMFISVFTRDFIARIPDMMTIILGCLNSCCNPLIYGVMNKRFRDGYIKLYCSLCRKRKINPWKSANDFSDTVE